MKLERPMSLPLHYDLVEEDDGLHVALYDAALHHVADIGPDNPTNRATAARLVSMANLHAPLTSGLGSALQSLRYLAPEKFDSPEHKENWQAEIAGYDRILQEADPLALPIGPIVPNSITASVEWFDRPKTAAALIRRVTDSYLGAAETDWKNTGRPSEHPYHDLRTFRALADALGRTADIEDRAATTSPQSLTAKDTSGLTVLHHLARSGRLESIPAKTLREAAIIVGDPDLSAKIDLAALRAAAPKLITALHGLVNWGRDHTSAIMPNSPHALLIAGCEALEDATGKTIHELDAKAAPLPAANTPRTITFLSSPSELDAIIEPVIAAKRRAVEGGSIAELIAALEDVLPFVPGYSTGDHAGRPHLARAVTAVKAAKAAIDHNAAPPLPGSGPKARRDATPGR